MKKEIVKAQMIVKNTPISVIRCGNVDFISLTDLAKYQNSSDPSFTVKNWLRRVSTIDYIGLWEQFTIQILIWSNSTKLKLNMVKIHLQCLLLNGLKEQIVQA